MTRDDATKPPQAGPAGDEARRRRLAAELRANLKRRKVQARARQAVPLQEEGGGGRHRGDGGDKKGR